MRVVLDTNILVSAVLFGGVSREILRHAIRGRLDPVTSPVLLDEFERLLEEKFAFSRAAAVETRSEFEVLAVGVQPEEVPTLCRDPDDNEVLAAAAAGLATAVVTGDRDLLVLGSYESIEIVTPAVFVERLA